MRRKRAHPDPTGDAIPRSRIRPSRTRLCALLLATLVMLLPACSRELQRACVHTVGPEDSCGNLTCFTSNGEAYRPPCDQSGSGAPWLLLWLLPAAAFWGAPAYLIHRAAKARGLDSGSLIGAWTFFGGLGLAYLLFKGIPVKASGSDATQDGGPS